MKKLINILIVLFIANHGFSQDAESHIRNGNEFYRQGEFEKAEASYNEALALEPGNSIAKFNKASATSKLNKQDEAIKQFEDISQTSPEVQQKEQSHYNKGAILSKQKKLEESIEAYKKALRLDPTDVQARENLQKALIELKKKQPPPKKEDEKKNQDKKKQPQQPKMNKREAEQKLKLLEQKEKELQQRMQNQKQTGSGGQKDW
jgi:tetratricopeptide (TPR) repeat protein